MGYYRHPRMMQERRAGRSRAKRLSVELRFAVNAARSNRNWKQYRKTRWKE